MTTLAVPLDGLANRTDPLSVMHRMFDEGFAIGNTDIVDEVCAPDMIEHQFGLAGRGSEALQHVKAAISDVHGMAPDIQFTIEASACVGDTVWVRVRGHGTSTGAFFGPPSNRPFEITVFDMARVVDGQIVEHWGVPDRFALLAQTGVLGRLAPREQ